VAPIVHLKAKPVFVDINLKNWCIDPSEVEKKITNQIQEIDSSFNIYIKKFSDTSEQFKLNDTIRGNMPIEDIRQLSSNFICVPHFFLS